MLLCTRCCVAVCFQFSWVNTGGWNCWVIRYFSVWLFWEKESVLVGEGKRERDYLKQAPSLASGSTKLHKTWSSHDCHPDLSQNQEAIAQPSETPRHPLFLAFWGTTRLFTTAAFTVLRQHTRASVSHQHLLLFLFLIIAILLGTK